MLRFSKKLMLKAFTLMAFLSVMVAVNTMFYDDYQTHLLPGYFLKDGMSDLKANRWSVPVVYDWNNDGKKDLLVGNRTYRKDGTINQGYINFYNNVGSDEDPSFSGFTPVEACSETCVSLTVVADG